MKKVKKCFIGTGNELDEIQRDMLVSVDMVLDSILRELSCI